MLNFKTLSIRNFFSYGNQITVFDLSKPGITMIVGENLDDVSDGRKSNGVGKSVIVDALCYAIYEEPLSKIERIDSIINFTNNKDMYVVVEFEKDGNQYRIERGRATKDKRGKNFGEILINGVDKTPAGGKNFNKFIENIIGMPYDAFCRIVVFSATNEPFLKLGAAKSREVIETLFGLTELTEKEAILKEYIKETNGNIKHVQANYEQREVNYLRYINQLQSADERVSTWDLNHQLKISQLTTLVDSVDVGLLQQQLIEHDEISQLTTAIVDITKEINSINAQAAQATQSKQTWDTNREATLTQFQTDLSELQSIDIEAQRNLLNLFNQSTADLFDITKEANDVAKQITAAVAVQSAIDLKIKEKEKEITTLNDATCPYCEQHFADFEQKLKTAQQQLEQLIESKESQLLINQQLTDNHNHLTGQINTLNQSITSLNEQLYFKSVDQLNDTETQITILQNKITDLSTQENPHTTTLNNIDMGLVSELSIELDTLNETLKEKEKNISGSGSKADIQTSINNHTLSSQQLIAAKTETNPHCSALEELLSNPLEEPDKTQLNELMDDLEHQKFLQKLLINKDSFVRKSLLSRSLPFLNTRLSHYLTQLGFRYKVEFTPQLSANISEFGKELEFGNMSGGQAARLNFALALAFRDVLEQMHTTVNVCILDEILDVGLDGPGITAATKIIKSKSRQNVGLFLISHREELENVFDKKLLIQMDKRFSYVVQ